MRPKPALLVRDRLSCVCAAALLVCVVASLLAAQVDRASLNGTVTDPTGARVPGVKVEAILAENGKQREALTNDAGIYAIPTLPVGTSTISFSRDGFHALRYDDVELKVGQTFTLDARLALGSVSTQVDSQGDGAAAGTQLGRAGRRGRRG